MRRFLKIFPLTTYATCVVLFIFSLDDGIQYDSNVITVFVEMVFVAPLIAIGQIYALLNIKASLPWVVPIFLLLDFLVLSIRKGHIKNFIKKLLKKSEVK